MKVVRVSLKPNNYSNKRFVSWHRRNDENVTWQLSRLSSECDPTTSRTITHDRLTTRPIAKSFSWFLWPSSVRWYALGNNRWILPISWGWNFTFIYPWYSSWNQIWQRSSVSKSCFCSVCAAYGLCGRKPIPNLNVSCAPFKKPYVLPTLKIKIGNKHCFVSFAHTVQWCRTPFYHRNFSRWYSVKSEASHASSWWHGPSSSETPKQIISRYNKHHISTITQVQTSPFKTQNLRMTAMNDPIPEPPTERKYPARENKRLPERLNIECEH